MANVRIIAKCKRCGVEGEHYTRKNGTKVSPCVACAIAATKARAAENAEDQDYVDKRREQYRRYNESEKGRARLAKHRNKPESDGEEPEPAGRNVVAMAGF